MFLFSLLFLSAFFSGSEAAFLSLTRLDKSRFEKSSYALAKIKHFFLNHTNQFIITILCCNLLINITATLLFNNIVTSYISSQYSQWSNEPLFVEILNILLVIVFTAILLIFCEIIPKKIALLNSNLFYSFGIFPLSFFYVVLYPISLILDWITQIIINIITKQKINNQNSIEVKEVLGYIKLSSETGVLKQVETDMLENLLHYRSIPVKAILTPRSNMQAIDIKTITAKNILQKIKSLSYKNIIFYEKLNDNIMGILSKKKLFYQKDLKTLNKSSLKNLLDRPKLIPENKNIVEALHLMYQENVDILFAVDEYGGIEGIVTYSDIVEKLLGKGFHYSDVDTIPSIQKLSQNIYLVDGLLNLSDINQYFNINLKCKYSKTLNGYLLEQFKDIPKVDEEYQDHYFKYTIRKVSSKKIIKVRMKKNNLI